MSVENAVQFVRQVCLDNTLKARMEAAASPDQVVSLARDLGYEVSVDELRTVADKFQQGELSDSKLESVAGGGFFSDLGSALYGAGGAVSGAVVDTLKAIVK